MEIEDNLKLKDVSSILPWYSEVNTDKTVEIVNYMKNQAMNGEQIFIQYTVKKKCRQMQIKRIQVYFSFGEM